MRIALATVLTLINLCFSEVAVVANPSFRPNSDLESILLGTAETSVVIYMTDDQRFNERAIRKLIGISYEDFKILWMEMALAGKGVPPRELPPEEVYIKVKTRKNAIGIVPFRYARDLKVLRVVR